MRLLVNAGPHVTDGPHAGNLGACLRQRGRSPSPRRFPANEVDRLADLHAYAILDTDPEEGFDDIARIASLLFGAPSRWST